MNINTRFATLNDVSELNDLIDQAVRRLSVGYYTSKQINSSLKYVFGVDTQLIKDSTYYVAESGKQIVGCGGWSKRNTLYGGDQTKGEEDPLLNVTHESGRIRAFFVHPEWARRGIGGALIKMCEEAACKEGFHSLELASTLPGEPLYRALGYQAREHFSITFPDGEHLPLIRMSKMLK